MFLNKLEDSEKIAFLMIAHHVARSDGDFSENEQNIISTYCMEMQIEDIDYDKKEFNLNKILLEFQNDESKKILLLEIMALIYSDGLNEEEQKILDIIIEQYDINESLLDVYAEWNKTILSVSKQGLALIRL